MVAAVDFDMTFEVITKSIQATRVLATESSDQFREHVRDQVLATESEGRGDLVDFSGAR